MRLSVWRVACAASVLLAGCASAQLNFNTLDLAASSDGLITSQVLFNLGKFRSSPYAIPSQVSIPSGSATTTNSITPTVSAPTGSAVTSTLANSAAAPVFFASTHSNVTPNGSVGGSVTDQWSQNWTLTPLEDPDQLRRLRALYRFGAGVVSDPAIFACEYPLVQKAENSGSGTSGQSVSVYVNGANASVQSDGAKSASNVTYTYDSEITNKCHWKAAGTPDPTFLKPPGCIICDYQALKPAVKPKKITFSGNLNRTTIDKISDAAFGQRDLKLVGSQIEGLCIPGSTTVKAINVPTNQGKLSSIEISQPATCNGETHATITPSAKPDRTLKVNPRLTNRWLWNPSLGLPPPDGLVPLGRHAGQELYLRPGLSSRQEYSDFILFVLEATLESTSTAGGGAGGKGTPQKGGAPSPLQAPAAPTLIE